MAKIDGAEQATLKKLVIDYPNRYLMPLNSAYSSIQIDEGCRIVGVAKKVIQDL